MKLPRQARWAVPAGAVAAVGIVVAGSVIAGAQGVPRLPARTTAQLIAAVNHPGAVPPAMTAVILQSASLGLPDLPGTSDPLSPLSLLSGSHTFKVWYDGPARVRIAVPVQLGETDLRRDGSSAWLWDSRTNQATHYLLPASSAAGGAPPADASPPSVPAPQQLARQILAAVGPTTTVGLQPNVMVAGQPAYQLSLAPKDGRSLIGQIRIAIDARNSMPLQVQVFARGAAGPAFSVGYASLSFAVPAASNFTFSPPPGAKVKTVTLRGAPSPMPVPAGLGGIVPVVPSAPPGASGPASIEVITPGSGQGAVAVRAGKPVPAAVTRQIEASIARSLPASLSKAQRAALVKRIDSKLRFEPGPGSPPQSWTVTSGTASSASSSSSGFVSVFTGSAPSSASALSAGAPTVLGQGWLSVLVLPGGLSAQGGSGPNGFSSALGAVMAATTPVHGSWGSGRLLRTSLVSVLFTGNGAVLIGATVPSVLYADAAHLG